MSPCSQLNLDAAHLMEKKMCKCQNIISPQKFTEARCLRATGLPDTVKLSFSESSDGRVLGSA